MKNENGITLTSVIIYIIGMMITIGIIATLTSFFAKNINMEDLNTDSISQFTSFTTSFSKEINNKNNKVIDADIIKNKEGKMSYIVFSTGNQYTFKNNSIYKNNVKLCENIEDCDFEYKYEDSKYIITVNFKTNKTDMTGDNAIVYNL